MIRKGCDKIQYPFMIQMLNRLSMKEHTSAAPWSCMTSLQLGSYWRVKTENCPLRSGRRQGCSSSDFYLIQYWHFKLEHLGIKKEINGIRITIEEVKLSLLTQTEKNP
jgi:hypothetical protein